MIKVYVVDDSAVVRQTVQQLLQGNAEVELVGSAPNPLIAGGAAPFGPATSISTRLEAL